MPLITFRRVDERRRVEVPKVMLDEFCYCTVHRNLPANNSKIARNRELYPIAAVSVMCTLTLPVPVRGENIVPASSLAASAFAPIRDPRIGIPVRHPFVMNGVMHVFETTQDLTAHKDRSDRRNVRQDARCAVARYCSGKPMRCSRSVKRRSCRSASKAGSFLHHNRSISRSAKDRSRNSSAAVSRFKRAYATATS